jgi:hypothetical protein
MIEVQPHPAQVGVPYFISKYGPAVKYMGLELGIGEENGEKRSDVPKMTLIT